MMVICGSCFVYVEKGAEPACSRCGDPLTPDARLRIQRFVANGSNPFYKGVPVPQAQEAAASLLSLLEAYESFIAHVTQNGDDELKALAGQVLDGHSMA